ncbi:MAG: DUF5069 domain-containing protein [Candidatus Eremiobacteraeota bacterium]|nr:DUF5069 domain-containing protein [Candidatus Eremiobacteraeota bacterium]
MPRTIDKLRARLPGGDPGEYFITGPIKGISTYMLERLGVTEADLVEVVRCAESDDDVARWLRERADVTQYATLNASLRRIKPKHADDPAIFNAFYAETLAQHPELEFIVDIIDADDRRTFPSG